MQTTEEIPGTYEEAERLLARWHAEGGPPDLAVFSFPDPAGEVVRLIEVSEEFGTGGGIVPLMFGRSELFPFKSGAAMVAPADWADVLAGRIELPAGWDLKTKRKVWP